MYTNVTENLAVPLYSYPQSILRQNFLQFIDEHIKLHSDADFFATLVTARIETINHLMPYQTDNLYQCITSDYAQTINAVVPLNDLDLYYIEIEKQAIELFGNILSCWAEYEHYRILQQVIKHPLAKNKIPQQVKNNKNITEVVAKIENDTRLFITPYSDLPMILSNAIALKIITSLVKEKHCYELLYFLALSANGEYVIHYQCTTLFPTLIATAHL